MRAPRLCMLVIAVLGCAACASGRSSNRFIQKRGSGPVHVMEGPWPTATALSGDAVRKAAVAAQAARPAPAPPVTIESRPGELRDALASLRVGPTAAAHVRVGLAYRRAGVLDQALDHFDAAVKLDSRMAAAYDGRARVWRDWGLPRFGMGDASRAIFFAPGSASAWNTLGTLLAAIDACEGARSAYEHARLLDPAAGYARANLHRVEQRMALGAPPCEDASAVNLTPGH